MNNVEWEELNATHLRQIASEKGERNNLAFRVGAYSTIERREDIVKGWSEKAKGTVNQG